MARAALLADDTPRAVWACHRGLELAPGDARLRDLLSLARERVVYPAPGSFGRPAPGRFPWLWPRGWGWGAIAVAGAAYALAWGALTRRRMTLRSRWTVVALLAGVVGLGAAGWAVAAEVARRYEDSAGVVVITHDGVLLRRGDGLAFPPRYETPLNRGAEARLLTRREDWLQIELGGGEVGWIPAEYALGE